MADAERLALLRGLEPHLRLQILGQERVVARAASALKVVKRRNAWRKAASVS